MPKTSGRFSRYPAINRDVAPLPRSSDEDEEIVEEDELDVHEVEDPGAEEVEETPAEVEPEAEDDQVIEVPEGLTVPETLDWVGDDEARRVAALEAERAREEPRKGVLEGLAAD